MTRLIFIAASMLAAAQISAGVRIETVTRDIQTHTADGAADVVLVQDGMVRSNHAKSSSDTTIIRDAKFYLLDDEKKTYFVVDEAAKKKLAAEAGAILKQMQERVKNLPPEQRARMEKNLGAQMPGVFGKKDTFESKDTGKNETVDGRECRLWNLHKNGVIVDELCVVPFPSLPGKEDFDKAFKGLSEVFVVMTAGVTNSADYFEARDSIGGYPVRTRSFADAGQQSATETVLTKWVEESLPASTFAIPASYKKRKSP